jgi:uncharacterized protein (DUF1330 family)
LEGESRSAALVLVEFPDVETAKRWYASPEYADARALRDRALRRDLLSVQGVKDAR